MRTHRLSAVPMLLVAAGGLVVGLAVPAAAHEARHLISGTSIKKHSITGVRLKNNTLTGKQIKESTLHIGSLSPLTWHPITHFLNGWTDGSIGSEGAYRSPAYAIDAQGTVHLRGSLSGGTPNLPAFILPTAASPAAGVALGLPMLDSGGNEGWLRITSAGVQPSAIGAGDAGHVMDLSVLEGVTFDPH